MTCPGSASYTIRNDGTVEVNGVVPVMGPEGKAKVQEIWQKYGTVISSEAASAGVNPAWIVGIILQESGGVAVCSPCSSSCCAEHAGMRCCAFGITQVIPSTAAMFGVTPAQLVQEPWTAIRVTAKLLRSLLDRYSGDVVAAAASYNAGSAKCGGSTTFGYQTEGDYPLGVIKGSNTAIALGLKSSSKLPYLILAASIFAAGFILKKRG